jgi:hypothetical protein
LLPNSSERRKELSATEFLRKLKVKIIPCPLCKTPNVLLQQQASFNEGYLRKDLSRDGKITQYQVQDRVTKALQDSWTVEEVYENQRRFIFGCFSADNLRTLDFRGAFSTENGCEVQNDHRKPNRYWVWLELDEPDRTLKKAAENGWMYASDWQTSRNNYEKEISIFHFVRTRRLLHTRIRISEALKDELKIFDPEFEDQHQQPMERMLSQ